MTTLLVCVLLCACNGDNSASIQTETTSVGTETSLLTSAVTSTETTSAVTSVETTSVTSEKIPSDNAPFVDENGLLTEKGTQRIAELSDDTYTGLFDFDGDGVPEVYTVHHNGNQGNMPCDIFSLESDEKLGSFEGYCRDGFTRLSRGDGCVYVHSFYEHSYFQRVESIQKLTFENGSYKTETILMSEAYAENPSFPLSHKYYITEAETTSAEYIDAFQQWRFDTFTENSDEIQAREANEVSLCNYDIGSTDPEDTAKLYNDYISALNKAKELSKDINFFMYRDFDGNGTFEAFFQLADSPNILRFISGETITEVTDKISSAYQAYDVDGLCILQPFSNWESCYVFEVKDGKPQESVLSGCGMQLERDETQMCTLSAKQSAFDSASPAGSHTWKPYWFFYDNKSNEYREYGGKLITTKKLNTLGDFSEAFSEIEAEGGIVGDIFTRLNGYATINYQIPDEHSDPEMRIYDNRYKLYFFNPYAYGKAIPVSYAENNAGYIEPPHGIYQAALNESIAVYPSEYGNLGANDENGFIGTLGKEKIKKITDKANAAEYGLFDFDGDGVPEVYTVPEKNTEKPVTCSLFRLETGEIIGEFYGCADSRLSRGDGCVYVHNFIETSDSRYEDVQKIVMSEDSLSSERILANEAKTANGRLNNSYYIGGNMPADMEAYTIEFVKWQTVGQSRFRLANEVCLPSADAYNEYIRLKESFSDDTALFMFGDFDDNGSYEAFVQKSGEALYFVSEDTLTEIENAEYINIAYPLDKMCVFQSEKSPALIFTVRNGQPVETELSKIGIDPKRSERFMGDYTILCSARDSSGTEIDRTIYGANTYKPYWFYFDEKSEKYAEYNAHELSENELSDLTGGSEIISKIHEENGTVREIYLRNEKLITINYTVPEENCIVNKCFVCEFTGDKLTVSDRYDGIYLPSAKP